MDVDRPVERFTLGGAVEGIEQHLPGEHAAVRLDQGHQQPELCRSERDDPTGALHLGHYVGTLANRVRLQDQYETFILVADYHMLTTRLDELGEIEQNIREDVLGNLAIGIDPSKTTIYLQSLVPEVTELFLYFAMLVTVPRAEAITEMGQALLPAMGVVTVMNFQPTSDGKAAITGDFVLIDKEVNTVAKTLRQHGVDVTAIHNHALMDMPRLFYMHFWANDDPTKLAQALKAALDQTNSRK